MKQSLKNIHFANSKNLSYSHSRDKDDKKQLNLSNNIENKKNIKQLEESKVKQQSIQNTRQRIIEQNIKLKTQILQLAHQIDAISSNSKYKKKYGVSIQPEDETTKKKQQEIKKQQAKISELKNTIFNLKKQMEYVYDESNVVQKTNVIKSLEIQMKQLEKERDGLAKIRKEQEKAILWLKNDHKYNQKIEKIKKQLYNIKQECKSLEAKTFENQKLLLKIHEKQVSKTKKIKQIQQKIKQNKEKLKKGNQNIVTVQMISQIEEQISSLEKERKQSQKSWQQKISNLDIELQNRRAEQQKKLLILKQKQKEVKLNDIRLKEFKKLIIQARSEKKIEADPIQNNLKEYRNRSKRNIKYLEK